MPETNIKFDWLVEHLDDIKTYHNTPNHNNDTLNRKITFLRAQILLLKRQTESKPCKCETKTVKNIPALTPEENQFRMRLLDNFYQANKAILTIVPKKTTQDINYFKIGIAFKDGMCMHKDLNPELIARY